MERPRGGANRGLTRGWPAADDDLSTTTVTVRQPDPLPEGSILLRDTAAETNAILQLQQAGLASLGSHAQYRFLLALEGKSPNPQCLDASTLWFPNPTHGELAQYCTWLRSNGTPILENSGWTVTFDDDIGHEVSDVNPDALKYVLEDDGTGWFHLSVGFDVGDEKLDLLPILAALLDQGASDVTLEFPAQGNFLHHLDDGRALNLPAERELMAEGIQCFASPSRERALEHPSNYYGWMLRGEALYRALEPSHPLASGLPSPGQRCCFETFPHAITCQLHRALGLEPAAASQKRLERRALLAWCGVACDQLSSIDWIDAALCALAADQAARGGPCRVYGEVSSGVLIVPTQLPRRPTA